MQTRSRPAPMQAPMQAPGLPRPRLAHWPVLSNSWKHTHPLWVPEGPGRRRPRLAFFGQGSPLTAQTRTRAHVPSSGLAWAQTPVRAELADPKSDLPLLFRPREPGLAAGGV